MFAALALALVLSGQLQATAARLLHSLPEDTYAYPKNRVTFLNALPLGNDTAQRWLREGIIGGEAEFLEETNWKQEMERPPLKGIAGGPGVEEQPVPQTHIDVTKEEHIPQASHNYTLEQMKLGRNEYLCLIPPPPEGPLPSTFRPEDDDEVTPAHTWSLLQPLAGTCLYLQQGTWFTYSYCHNDEVRQFRALPHAHPHPPGGYKPEEDPMYNSYTLGKAPQTPEAGAELTVAEKAAQTTNLELAKEAGSQYLVQKWDGGSVCDMTGKRREVEVQFHCSLTTTDAILFIKETKLCSYIMVIQTPRLCSLPGFRSRLDSQHENLIRCREVVDELSSVTPAIGQEALPESEEPYRMPRQQKKTVKNVADKAILNPDFGKKKGEDEKFAAALETAMQALTEQLHGDNPEVIQREHDGVTYIELDIPIDDLGQEGNEGLAAALRAAGFDIVGWKDQEEEEEKGQPLVRDEL